MKDKKKNFFKESFYATGFILISVYLLSLIEFNSDILNPVSKAFGDFQLTDVVFAHLKENPEADTNIVMVNLGPYTRDRRDLARVIEILAYYEPKVVGIDAFYRKPTRVIRPDIDPDEANDIDSSLSKAFSKLKHLVLVSELHENEASGICDSMEMSNPMFMKYAEPGFADMITKGKDHFKTSRECAVKEKVKIPIGSHESFVSLTKDTIINGMKQTYKKDSVIIKTNYKDTIFYSFPVKIVTIYAPEKAKAFVGRNNDYETINFQGNLDVRMEDVSSNAKGVFFTLDYQQVEDTLFDPSIIKDKIVIIGYLGDYVGDNAWEDKFFTPLNTNYIGKANPDMYGVVVHANVVSMILKGKFIEEMPDWINIILSIIFIFLNVWFFSYLYYKTEEWYDGLSLIITLVEILVLMLVVLWVFVIYSYKIDITLASVALFLTGNLIEIHFGIVMPTILKVTNKMQNLTKKVPIFTKN
jgi:CHASE2 domain-containing sensor protein